MTDRVLRIPAAVVAIGVTLLFILGDLWDQTFSVTTSAIPIAVAVPFVLPSPWFRRGAARYVLSTWLVVAATVFTLRAVYLCLWFYERRSTNLWWSVAAIQLCMLTAAWIAVFSVFRRPETH
jgi:hypothetical protein